MGTLADLLVGVRDSLGMMEVIINMGGMINVVVVIDMVVVIMINLVGVKVVATLAVVVIKIIIVWFYNRIT